MSEEKAKKEAGKEKKKGEKGKKEVVKEKKEVVKGKKEVGDRKKEAGKEKKEVENRKKEAGKEKKEVEKGKKEVGNGKKKVEKKKIDKKQIEMIVAIGVIIILVIAVATIFTEEKTGDKKERIKGNGIDISVYYPKDQGYEYKVIDSAKLQTSEISKEGEDFIINVIIDTETLKNNYKGDFEEYKEVKTAGISSEDITINGITGFGFYNSNEDKYQIILPYDLSQTVNIEVQPIIRFTGDSGEELFRREDVRKIIDSIKINKR